MILPAVALLLPAAESHGADPMSIARFWNEQNLTAIRNDNPHPPAQARNLFSVSVCMYDAWAAYTNGPVGYVYRGKRSAGNIDAARRETISYAAYRMLRERYSYSRTADTTLASLTTRMLELGYSPANNSRDVSTPAGLGNSIYDAVSAWFINDGCRQTNGTQAAPYPDYPVEDGGYVYTNPAMPTQFPGTFVFDVNRWQRLQIINAVDQNGFPVGPIQTYQGAQWLKVRPFALTRTDVTKPWIDPGPPPYLGGVGDQAFRDNVVAVIRAGSELTPDDGVTMDISPASYGNNNLGANDGTGHPLNPATGLPYPPNVVKRGDFVRVLAEFWADGPNSETPPGHWNVLANQVSDHPALVRRIGGTGPIVDPLEWDVKVYFALNAAVHEAACAAWSVKRFYDGWRPLAAIRYMGQAGQSTDPGLPSYDREGLPLVPGLIELITSQTIASGRHAGLVEGKIAVRGWPGQPNNPSTTYQGVHWLHADSWIPYQRTNFVTPPFPGYISGHSTFSRSAAEVMTAVTGSRFFPGGMFTYSLPADTGLGFEKGPSTPIQLQWATYYDAADQAGISRIWGGIHPPVDDFPGRRVGSQAGQGVWALASTYFDGSVTNHPVQVAAKRLAPNQTVVSFNTKRGFYYKVQSTSNLNEGFTDEPGGAQLALEGFMTWTNASSSTERFYRVVSSPAP